MTNPELRQQPEPLPHSQCWKFIEDGNYTPAQGYAGYCERRDELGLNPGLLYLSTTITSGGYSRFEDISKGEAIKGNETLARQLIDTGLIERGVPQDILLLPSELGKVEGWSQADYLSFWLYVIRAIHPDQAYDLEGRWLSPENSTYKSIAQRMESADTYEERQAGYIDFVSRYFEYKDTTEGGELLKPYWQPPAVLPVVDNNYSLGCKAEWYFGETVLPSWEIGAAPGDAQRKIDTIQGLGGMITGRTLEDQHNSSARSAARLSEYHAHK